jgi:luciferase family oxidoreductase group 1
MPKLSVLDLAPIVEGGDVRTTLARTADLARHVEALGYHRFWLAEHHGMPGIASAATSVVIAHVGAATRTIRVGAGGIMLPNHAPLVIAEQFGTLDALFPGRVDLGLGRAPGTDPLTTRALRRTLAGGADGFPDDVLELIQYFREDDGEPGVRAVPGRGANPEIWILGSSLFGAQLAAALGLPYAFASHFAPAELERATRIYRERFRPSVFSQKSRLMLGVNAIVADTDAEARLLSTSLMQSFLSLRRGKPGRMPPPREGFETTLTLQERALLGGIFACSFVGSQRTVKDGIERFAERTGADELIVAAHVFDYDARKRSYSLLAEAMKRTPPAPVA